MKKLINAIKNYFKKQDTDNSYSPVQLEISEIISFLKRDTLYEAYTADILKTVYIPELQGLYEPLDIVLQNIYSKLYEEEKSEEMFYEASDPDAKVAILLNALSDKKEGIRNIEWSMIGWDKSLKNVSFEAYSMDSDTWKVLELYSSETEGNSEGYEFNFILGPVISEIRIPFCECGEVGSIDTIEGNCIDSNCDTWGSMYGTKAKSLYAFYVTDLDKYGVVEVEYWCM